MRENDEPMNRDELLDLIPAYALGALDADEQDAVEAFLRNDSEARALLADYEQVTSHLVTLAPFQPAPDHLQDDLRQRLAARRAGDLAAPSTTVRPSLQVLQPRFTMRRRSMLAAALIVVILAGLILARGWYGGTKNATPNAARLYATLTGQEGAQRIALVAGEVREDVSGEVIIAPTGDQAVIRVERLPVVDDEHTFQLWLIDQTGSRTSGGLFRPANADAPTFIYVPLEGSVERYQGFGVSLEPAGGSPYSDQPTGPRVFSVPLS